MMIITMLKNEICLFATPVPLSRCQCQFTAKRSESQTSVSNVTCFTALLKASTPREEKAATSQLLVKYPEARSGSLKTLAPRHYINLTNGVEALQSMQTLLSNENELRFMRLQSSHCESGAYNKILASLDDDLLFSLACGRQCYVYDYASRNKATGVPRSLFLGLQFVKWSLAYLWFGTIFPTLVPSSVMVRGKNTVPFWRDHVMPYKVSKDTKRKLRYYASFTQEMGVKAIKLSGVYGRFCETDGCKNIHTKMVREWLELSECHPTDSEEHHRWMNRSSLALYDPQSTEDELVQVQEYLKETGRR